MPRHRSSRSWLPSCAPLRKEWKYSLRRPLGLPRSFTTLNLEQLEDRITPDTSLLQTYHDQLINGLDLYLTNLQQELSVKAFGLNLVPVVGSHLSDALKFIDGFHQNLISTLNSQFTAASLTGMDATDSASLQTILFKFFGQSGNGLLETSAGAQSTSMSDVGVTQDSSHVQFDLVLGQTTFTCNKSLGFDLAIPQISFALSPGVQVQGSIETDYSWSTAFSFGVQTPAHNEKNNAFYVDTSAQDPSKNSVSVNVAVTTPGLDIKVQYSIWQAHVTEEADNPNLLLGTYAVQLGSTGVDSQGMPDPRLKPLAGNQLTDSTSFTGGLVLNLFIDTGINPSFPGSDGLPHFMFTINLGLNMNGATTDPNVSGQSILGNPAYLEFNNITLDLGSYLKTAILPFAKPLTLLTLQYDFLISQDPNNLGFLYKPVPLYSDLTGDQANWLTLAKQIGDPRVTAITKIVDGIAGMNTMFKLLAADPSNPAQINIGGLRIQDLLKLKTQLGSKNATRTATKDQAGNAAEFPGKASDKFTQLQNKLPQGVKDAFNKLKNKAGSFNSSGSPDIRKELAKTAAVKGAGQVSKIQDFVGKYSPLSTSTTNQTDVGFKIPLLDPLNSLDQVFRLILGQFSAVDLARFDAKVDLAFTADFSPAKVFDVANDIVSKVPALGKFLTDIINKAGSVISIQLSGSVDLIINFSVGYDASGLAEFVQDKKASDLLDGFYVAANGGQGIFFNASVNGSAGIDVDLNFGPTEVFLKASASGGVDANVGLALIQPDTTNTTGKIRLPQLLSLTKDNFLCLFDASGAIDFNLNASYSVGIRVPHVFSKSSSGSFPFNAGVAADFYTACPDRNNPAPILATVLSDGTLQLNLGTNAKWRGAGDLSDGDDNVTITHTGVDNNGHEIVTVSAFGLTQTYMGVQHIYADAGLGNNTITVVNVTSDVKLFGGPGNNTFDCSTSSGPVTMSGNDGNQPTTPTSKTDHLKGGSGNNVIYGGSGTNYITVAGSATNQLYGGLGDNFITGGMGPDLIVAGPSNNTLDGTAGSDTYVVNFLGTGSRTTCINDSGPSTDVNELLVNAPSIAGSLTVTATQVTMAAETIKYINIESLVVTAGAGGGDTINVLSVNSITPTTINGVGGQNTYNVGSRAPLLAGGVVDYIKGPLVIVGGGADSMNVDDTGSTGPKTGTLTESTLTGLNMAGITYSGLAILNIALGSGGNTLCIQVSSGTNLAPTTAINGGSSSHDSLKSNWGQDFNGTLILTAFETSALQVNRDFNGFLSDTLPGIVQQISVGRSLTATGKLIASSLGTMTMGQDLAGLVQIAGAANSMTVNGTLSGQVSVGADLTTLSVGHDLSGIVKVTGKLTTMTVGKDISGKVLITGTITTMTVSGSISGLVTTGGDLKTLFVGKDVSGTVLVAGLLDQTTINGSVTATGSINAGNVNNMSIALDVAGLINAVGNIQTLSVGRSVTYQGNIIAGGNFPTMTVGPDHLVTGDDMAGQVTVAGTFTALRVAGGTPGNIFAGHVGTVRTYGGYGPYVLQIKENGIQRRVEAAVPGPSTDYPLLHIPPFPPTLSPAGVIFQYFYEGDPNRPILTGRVYNNASSAPDQYDLSLVTYNDTAKFNLARLDAAGVSGIGNVAVEGDLLTSVTPTASSFFPGDNAPAGVRLPADALAGVAVRDYAPNGFIQAKSIQAVAFGSHSKADGSIETGAVAVRADAARLLTAGTAIVQANDTFRIPFADLPTQRSGFFFAENSGNFGDDNDDSLYDGRIVFSVQGVSRPNSSNTDNIITPSNVARGAVTALVKIITANVNGWPVQRIDLRGDGGSITTEEGVAQAITSTGPVADLTISSRLGINNLTMPSMFGSLITSGPIFGTAQTTGQRLDPITGQTSPVAADLGRIYVNMTSTGPVLTATQVLANRGGITPGITGRLISRGDLLSQVLPVGGISGLVAVQGNLGTFVRLAGNPVPVRLGGILTGLIKGQILVLGSVMGDIVVQGSLVGGRIAVQGDVLSNLTINGSIDANSVLVVGGKIGDATAGTALRVPTVNGIVAAKGNIRLAGTPNTTNAKFFRANIGTGNPSATAIDALFMNMGNPLAFDQNGLDLNGLGLMLANLGRLRVGSNGNLTDQ